MAAAPVIEAHGLRRSFRSRRGPVEAVAGVDLRVEAGEIFGFLGPNGAGKTTTLRLLATLLTADGGEATVAGHDLRREPAQVRRRIGYVGQAGGANRAVTGRGDLVFQGRLFGLSRAEARSRAAELLTLLGLDDCADRQVATYSGGQRRRLEVGLGLVHQPALLFLDEPTTGLDPQARANLWDEARRLRERGVTIFLTTHYLEEADALCDRLAIMDKGRIVDEGTPDDLKRRIAGDVVRLRVAGDPATALGALEAQPFVREASAEDGALRLTVERGETALPDILRQLDWHGVELEAISVARPSLDDVFLLRTGRSLREEAAA